MRTLTIAIVTAFVFLLAQQLTAASPGSDQEANGASQAVVGGSMGCFPNREFNLVYFQIDAVLGVIGISGNEILTVARSIVSEECSDLTPALVEQVPDHICEIGNHPESQNNPDGEFFGFVCTGRADVVISAVGRMARAVIRLGQP